MKLDSQEHESDNSATRSVERAACLLKLLARQGEGIRLTELAEEAGLHKATALRLLGALTRQGLADRDPDTKRYRLGMELLAAGWTSIEGGLLREYGSAALRRIAETTGDTAYFSVRSGLTSLCLERREGDFPIKTLTLGAGDRRPLGVGAGSLALLAFLRDGERRAVLDEIEPLLAPYPGYSVRMLREHIDESRRLGHVFNPGLIVPGMQAVAVPALTASGAPIAALSVAAITERMAEDRRAMIVALLREEAERIEAALRRRGEAAKRSAKQTGPGKRSGETSTNKEGLS